MNHATGFKSLATTSQPSRIASSGMAPPREGVQNTRRPPAVGCFDPLPEPSEIGPGLGAPPQNAALPDDGVFFRIATLSHLGFGDELPPKTTNDGLPFLVIAG